MPYSTCMTTASIQYLLILGILEKNDCFNEILRSNFITNKTYFVEYYHISLEKTKKTACYMNKLSIENYGIG
jgi:hypothetical protein